MTIKIELKTNYFLYIFINFIILLFCALIFDNFGIFFVGLIGLIIVTCCSSTVDNLMWKRATICTAIAFAWMIFQYFCLIEKFGKPYFASDDEFYEHYGNIFYSNHIYFLNQNSGIPEAYIGARGYFWLIAWIMRICNPFGGFHTIAPRVLNIYFWISTCFLVYQYMIIQEENLDEVLLRNIATVLMIFPNALYISSFVYRDTYCGFLIVTFSIAFYKLYHTIKTGQTDSIFSLFIQIVIMILTAYLLACTRSTLLMLCAGIVGIHLLMGEDKNAASRRLLLILVFLIVGLGIGYQEVSKYSKNYSSYILYTMGSNEGLSGIIFSTPIFPFGFILRGIWGLVSPFPGEIFQQNFSLYPMYSTLKLIVYIGTIFGIFCIPYLFKGLKMWDANALISLLTYFMVVLVTFGFRHFILIYPFFAIEIYYGLVDSSIQKIRKNSGIIFLLIIIAGITYYMIK